jgi:hypothetical protein
MPTELPAFATFPAYPCSIHRKGALGEDHVMQFTGMTIRQKIALDVLCARLSTVSLPNDDMIFSLVKGSWDIADAFIQHEFEEAQRNAPAEPPVPPSVIMPIGGGPRPQ